MKFNKEVWIQARRTIENGTFHYACIAIRHIASHTPARIPGGDEINEISIELYVREFTRVAVEMWPDRPRPPFWNRSDEIGDTKYKHMRLSVFDKMIGV